MSRAQTLDSDSPPALLSGADVSDADTLVPEAQSGNFPVGSGGASAEGTASEPSDAEPQTAPIASPAEPADAEPPVPAEASGAAASEPPVKTPPKELEISADQQGFDLVINRYVASGNAKAVLAGGRLMADRLEYDTTTRTLYATGSVRFWRGQQYLQGSMLRYGLIEGEG
ncbi:MAG: DUF3769 domain-containing protein, partial [Prochlorococcaceae cyanobacterium]